MKGFIILTFLIAVEISNVIAKEDKHSVIAPAEQLCSEVASSKDALRELKGAEVIINVKVSSIGDKRRVYLGNRIDSIVELVITPEPRKDPFGKEIPDRGCYISCFIDVPGVQCGHHDGKLECKEITSPKLEENIGVILKLSGDESITVRGDLGDVSLIPLYSIGGHKRQIVNAVLSKCEIVEIKKR